MGRIKIILPENFRFSVQIPIRITDVNYGGHVGNDAILSIIHEARMQFLQHYGYNEMNLGGVGVIMCDVGIEFKNETFYGDVLNVDVSATDFSKIGFDIIYKLVKIEDGVVVPVAFAKTGMVCYDYVHKKVVAIPTEVIHTLQSEI